MTEPQAVQPLPEERSGRSRLAYNVAWSWGGHFVTLVGGFFLPRLVDRHLGQTVLGVWDFCWSLVGYFTLVQFGFSTSVNRYIAKCRAAGDLDGLNRVASVTTFIQLGIGSLILCAAVGTAWAVPQFWSQRLGGFVQDTRWIVLILGASIAVRTFCGTYAGVLTGCHRWDLYNGINAASHGVVVTGMLVCLILGGSLVTFAGVYALEPVLVLIGLSLSAHRVCPGLSIRFSHWNSRRAREMLHFGGKAFVNDISRLLWYQSSSLMIVAYLGPAALACYSRPMALVGHVGTLTGKFANTLTPIATELQTGARREEMKEFLIQTLQAGAALALPPLLFLCVLGGPLVGLWMGGKYQMDSVVCALALGHLFTIANTPLRAILIGFNAHGRPAIATLIGALGSVVLTTLALGNFGAELWGPALALGLGLWAVDGVFLLFYGSKRLGIAPGQLLRRVWLKPLACTAPFATVLVTARLCLPPTWALLVGILVGGAVLAPVYWKWLLPPKLRARLADKLAHRWDTLKGRWGSPEPATDTMEEHRARLP